MLRTFILIFILALSIFSNAQQIQNECTSTLTEAQKHWLQNFQQEFYSGNHEQSQTRGTRYIPFQAHIVGDDDGNGYYALDQLYTLMCELNETFESVGFYFYLTDEINYIDNTAYYDHNTADGRDMMQENNLPDVMNVYFVESPNGNCGYYSGARDAIAMAKSCSRPGYKTMGHEIGHYFSLPHTFSGWEGGDPPPVSQQEKVDGSNCNNAGDGFCDTPPDYAYYRWNCPFTGPFYDPDGVEFIPDGTFIMSYSDNDCRANFGNDQSAAMNAFLLSQRADLLSGSAPAYVELDRVETVTPENEATDLPPNYVYMEWEEAPGAVSYHLQIALNPAFTAIIKDIHVIENYYEATGLDSLRTYRWRVKPVSSANTCAPYSLSSKFSTSDQPTAIMETDAEMDFYISPNPPSNEMVNVVFNSQQPFFGKMTVLDVSGKVLLERTQNFSPGTHSEPLNIDYLDAGIYIVQLSSDNVSLNKKLLIVK